MNKVMFIGRLTRDAVVYKTKTNMEYFRYSIAVSEYSREDNTLFLDCVDFSNKKEFCEKYLKKGVKVAIVGKLQSYTKTQNNTTNNYIVVNVNELEFCESKKNSETNTITEEPKEQVEKVELQPVSDEDCPF